MLEAAAYPPLPVALRVRERGMGPPLLLLHGLGSTGDEFALLTTALSQTHRVIVPDLRGHGWSGHLPCPCDAGAIAADLAPTLDALGIGSAHVLGHSHGGAAAQIFARQHPQRVRSLLLVSTYTRQRLTWWERLTGLLAPPVVAHLGTSRLALGVRWLRPAGGGRKLSARAAALRAATLAANDPRRLAAALRAARRSDSRAWLGDLQAPTLVITGQADLVVVPRQTHLLAAGIPGARLRVLAGAGHELPLSHPEELVHCVTPWLHGIEYAPSPPGPRGDAGAGDSSRAAARSLAARDAPA